MKTLEVTDEVYEMLTCYHPRMTPSEVVIWWREEVFMTRMASMQDSNFGR